MADVAVEVAIRALGSAERPMHINAESGGALRYVDRGAQGGTPRCRSASSLNARARWESASGFPGRQPCFSSGADLAERPRVSVWQEHRIVAKTLVAARRPDKRSVDAAGESLDLMLRGGERQRSDELRTPLLRRCGAFFLQRFLHLAHGEGKILRRPRPPRRIDSGSASERIRRQGRNRLPAPPARMCWPQLSPSGSRSPRKLYRSPSGSVSPSSTADLTAIPNGPSRSMISRTFPRLWLATTIGPGARRIGIAFRAQRASAGRRGARSRAVPAAAGLKNPRR